MSSPTPSSSGSRSPNPDQPRDQHDNSPEPRSTPASSSSSSSSSPASPSSSTRPHHLLPPLIPPPSSGSSSSSSSSSSSHSHSKPNPDPNHKPGGPIFANEILDPELLGHRNPTQRTTNVNVNPSPEKCFTFCTQAQDRQPLCRMFCMRRRRPVVTQGEQLAKLRPEKASAGHDHDHDHDHDYLSTSTSTSTSGTGRWWNPFKALENRFAPYSFIYIKGTPEGVVGRYMEELEGDDGNSDFGAISRGASDLTRRKNGGGMEYIDWGEHGALLHLPLTSLFYPIITFPQTLERVFKPSLRLLGLYKTSFEDGAQERNLAKIRKEFEEGGAFKLLDKLGSHYTKKIGERRVEVERQIKEREEIREKKQMEVEKELKEKGSIVFNGTSTSAKERERVEELERLKRS